MKSRLKTRERAAALGFVAPLFIGYAVFTVVPFVVAVIYSLVDYMPLQGKISPVSFDVYLSLFKGDLVMVGFSQAILNTLVIMLSIPVNLLLGLAFSAMITQKDFRGGTFFRVVFYLPAVTGAVAITLVWKLMFNETQGIVNIALKARFYLLNRLSVIDFKINLDIFRRHISGLSAVIDRNPVRRDFLILAETDLLFIHDLILCTFFQQIINRSIS